MGCIISYIVTNNSSEQQNKQWKKYNLKPTHEKALRKVWSAGSAGSEGPNMPPVLVFETEQHARSDIADSLSSAN